MTNVVSWALVWQFMLQSDGGFINMVLNMFRAGGDQLAVQTKLVIHCGAGDPAQGLRHEHHHFIGALQEVPQMYYEAASRRRQQAPAVFPHHSAHDLAHDFPIIIITMIGSAQGVRPDQRAHPGRARHSQLWMVYYIYQVAFKMNKFGYGSAPLGDPVPGDHGAHPGSVERKKEVGVL